MVVSGSSSVSGLHRETTVLSLVMAYRSFGRFRQASTRLDTPPCSGRHHPVSAIAPAERDKALACLCRDRFPRQKMPCMLRIEVAAESAFLCLGDAVPHGLAHLPGHG